MSTSSGDRNPVERLAEEFLERQRLGERPALTDYVNRYPEWAEEIREVFPALMMMERLKPAQDDITGSFAGGPRPLPNHVPEQLGDFRILREVGRGGMGIVYEATQESLDRHVALKVLPSHSLLNPKHLLRFRREARAAARLHHTNIVPVFGMGETAGQHYYVMQFIVGSGVHEVVDELKRLKALGSDTNQPKPAVTRGASLAAITEGFLLGRFLTADTAVTPPSDSPNGTSPSSIADSSPSSLVQTQSSENFAKAVARMGVQVARALEYAHIQGVFHRDIKPSNLLLDIQGTAWVADFGLAKTLDDTDNISVDGDMLGTLRYMAPERFKGHADGRSDIYALGLTLYELLTLRPAFDETDQNRLILQVTTATPPRPRSINREIPRDLETIVLKAIEHEPGQRYQNAGEMADDLDCFIENRPIGARSVGNLERAWKWAKRKPAVAGLMAALALSLTFGFIGITSLWVEALAARDKARLSAKEAREYADRAAQTVDTFYTKVSEEELLDQPGMQPLRRRLLKLALGFYEEVQRQKGDDPKLMRALAAAALRSGLINLELGNASKAYPLLLKSKDILAAEVQKQPDDIPLLLLLVQVFNELTEANIGSDLGMSEIRISRAELAPAFVLMEKLVEAEPDNPKYLRLLGRSLHFMAFQDIRVFSEEDRVRFSIKSINMLKRVRDVDPEDHEAARWLALAYSEFALLDSSKFLVRESSAPQASALDSGGSLDRLLPETSSRPFELADSPGGTIRDPSVLLARAMEIFGSLEQRFPVSRRHRLERAECLVRLATVEIDTGRFAKAAAHLDEAHSKLAKIASEDIADSEVRYWLGVSQQRLGQLALAHGRREALPLIRESIATHERVPEGASPSVKELIGLALSQAWLADAELQAGLMSESARSLGPVRLTLKVIPTKTLIGEVVLTEGREIDLIKDRIESIRLALPGLTLGEQIAATRNQFNGRKAQSKNSPANQDLRYQAAWESLGLANFLRKDGQLDEARTLLEAQLPILKELYKSVPAYLRWKQSIARALEIMARVEAKSGHAAEALKAADEAVKIMEELASADSAYLFDLACTLSVRFEVAQSQADATATFETLGKAFADGFANDHRLQTDDRLDSLRSRPEFPKLPSEGSRSPRG